MENYILDIYHYQYTVNAYLYLYEQWGWWLFLSLLVLYSIRAPYRYCWYKLIFLHIFQFLFFILLFNNGNLSSYMVTIFEFFDFKYYSLKHEYINFIALVYIYSTASLALIYISAISFERYTLWFEITTVSNFLFNSAVRIYKKLTASKQQTKQLKHHIQKNKYVNRVVTAIKTSFIPQSKDLILPKQTKFVFKDSGPKVYDEDNNEYTIQKEIGTGGEGKVYIVTEFLLVKIFHNNQATNEKLIKLEKFLSIKNISSVVFPEKIIYDKNKNFIGYI